MSATTQLHDGLTTCMGRAGVLHFKEVAKRAGVAPLTVREMSDGTTVGTLRKIAAALPYSKDGKVHQCSPADLLAEVKAKP